MYKYLCSVLIPRFESQRLVEPMKTGLIAPA